MIVLLLSVFPSSETGRHCFAASRRMIYCVCMAIFLYLVNQKQAMQTFGLSQKNPGDEVKSYGDHRSCEIVERDTKESDVQWTKLHSPFIAIRQLLPKWVITRTPNHNPNLNSNPNYISSKWSCIHFNITYFVYDCPAKTLRASKPLKLIRFVVDRESW